VEGRTRKTNVAGETLSSARQTSFPDASPLVAAAKPHEQGMLAFERAVWEPEAEPKSRMNER
jgi:hypothetical protein